MAKYSPSATRFACSFFAWSFVAALLLLLAPGSAMGDQEDEPADRLRAPDATAPMKAPGGATLWVNPSQWNWVKSDRENTIVFMHATGMAQARLVVTDQPGTNRELLDGLLTRLKKIDPEPELLFEETRRINGEDMLCAQIRVTDSEERSVVYYGVAAGRQVGSFELFTITMDGMVGEFYNDLTKIIEGLELPAGAK